MNNKVLACIDHSSYTLSVCDHAVWAAQRLAAPLEFIHVHDRHPERAQRVDLSGSIGLGAQENLLEDLTRLDEERSKIEIETGRQLLEAAKSRAIADGLLESEGRQRNGELVETLAELEHTARLFVLGRRGEAAAKAAEHIGSNLERVVRSLHRPILVVPKDFRTPRSFMITYDGSATTRKGVDMIAASPLFTGMPCHLVMAGSAGKANEQLEEARQTLVLAGFQVIASLLSGDVETALQHYQREHEIDLLVMGAYGHSRIRQFLVGSTTTEMLRCSNVPVLLLR